MGNSLFNKWCWENWIPTYRRKIRHLSHTKLNSKWVGDFNGRPQTVKLLEESTGKSSLTLVLEKIFLDMIPRVQAKKKKATLNKWDYYPTKKLLLLLFVQQKKRSAKYKGDLQNGRKYLQNTYLIKC